MSRMLEQAYPVPEGAHSGMTLLDAMAIQVYPAVLSQLWLQARELKQGYEESIYKIAATASYEAAEEMLKERGRHVR